MEMKSKNNVKSLTDQDEILYFLKEGCNYLEDAVAIFDAETKLIYANKKYCEFLHIKDYERTLGMTIEELANTWNLKMTALSENVQYKVKDVIDKGKSVLNWEVNFEYKNEKCSDQIISSNMYPVKDENGTVIGVIEVTNMRREVIKNVKKLIGLNADYTFDDIIGESQIMQERKSIAKSYAETPLNILLTGESGVGKELFASSIHNYSDRRKGPFVALNCASFPEQLIESELFGYVGGAFTGASKTGQVGKFELADGGTLFLDEIGELPLNFQSKLLRVLETWKINRIGSNKPISVNVRLVAATNRNLKKMVKEGSFREDLYYRIQTLNVEIPPLRKRKEDIADLFYALTKQFAGSNPYLDKKVSPQALDIARDYEWPGNIRELRNVVNRSCVLARDSDVISTEVMEKAIFPDGKEVSQSVKTQSLESRTPEERIRIRKEEYNQSMARLLEEALEISNGDKETAGKLIGVSRMTFYRMMSKYHVKG